MKHSQNMHSSEPYSQKNIQFTSLNNIQQEGIIALMNHKQVNRQLPLMLKHFTKEDCQHFLAAKQQLWDQYGYGPHAILINGQFAGWGGLQPEDSEADVALILHPQYWGWGRQIFNLIKHQAFQKMGLDSITALLPLNRNNSNAITRLGFIHDGEVTVSGKRFYRFRLFSKDLDRSISTD